MRLPARRIDQIQPSSVSSSSRAKGGIHPIAAAPSDDLERSALDLWRRERAGSLVVAVH